MDIILLGVTVVSLIVALVMSAAAWRLMRDEKRRSAARVAALTVAAGDDKPTADDQPKGLSPQAKAPWSAPRVESAPFKSPFTSELPLNQTGSEPVSPASAVFSPGFLGAVEVERDHGGRQKSLAFAAAILFVVLSGGLVWMMSGARGTSAVAVGPNSPLELVSLSHARQNEKLAVSGLVRNPASGAPVERLSAVVFLFDRVGTFVASSRANVDFLKLGAGDESPFVVSLDAPPTVARYRVSFRTDDGILPHIDRRGASPSAVEGEQPINVSAK